jgi:hypothetical protein
MEDGMRLDELEFRTRSGLPDNWRPGREEVKTEIMNPGLLQDMIPGKERDGAGSIEKK